MVNIYSVQDYLPYGKNEDQCPQAPFLSPTTTNELWEEVGATIAGNHDFQKRAIEWLSGAVKVPTESYDGLPAVKDDPSAWTQFGPFHEYLEKAFPLIHENLKLEKVNTYGLLYTWEGSDSTLQPALFMAHQDVVPVEQSTVDEWTHPPYSGYYDGEFIWGRGSSDDKSGLIGTMISIETLLSEGFKPTRTFLLSFGFDEESKGNEGAGYLGEFILNRYGKHRVAFLIDEGGGFSDAHGTTFATPGVAEKGYLDVRVEVSAPGGHSSIPPAHTSIGILSHLIFHIENHPYPAVLVSALQCQGAHAKAIPLPLQKLIHASQFSDAALLALQEVVLQNPTYKALVGTTQAVDLVGGGAKVNALPERAWAVVNHRLSTETNLAEVEATETDRLKSLAHRYNLTFSAFGRDIVSSEVSSGALVLAEAFGNPLEPAPRTPITTSDAPWQLLSGTIRSVYGKVRGLEEGHKDGIVVSPGQSTGNTDTRYYWDVTKVSHLRYNHSNGKGGRLLGNIHTVNEKLHVESFLEQIYFFTTLILNSDEARDL
ncbi:carboxypeptidase S [Flagelloscypha sp. PMI_526]|nr:carboxypeptidase S [Flagelloscypha sp. PMI_526]